MLKAQERNYSLEIFFGFQTSQCVETHQWLCASLWSVKLADSARCWANGALALVHCGVPDFRKYRSAFPSAERPFRFNPPYSRASFAAATPLAYFLAGEKVMISYSVVVPEMPCAPRAAIGAGACRSDLWSNWAGSEMASCIGALISARIGSRRDG